MAMNTNMRKIVAALLACAMLFAFTACGKKGEDKPEATAPAEPSASAPAESGQGEEVPAADPAAEAKASLKEILDEIYSNVAPGTAGSSLGAVPYAVKLLDLGQALEMKAEDVKAAITEWLDTKGSQEKADIQEKLRLVVETCETLLTDKAQELLDAAGLQDLAASWEAKAQALVQAVKEAAGIADDTADAAWKADFEQTLLDEYGVKPDHYEDLGDGIYQVYVEIDGKVVPYVTVDSATGDFHG